MILLLLYPLAPAVIVGTDIVYATVLSLVAGFAHILDGNVDRALALIVPSERSFEPAAKRRVGTQGYYAPLFYP